MQNERKRRYINKNLAISELLDCKLVGSSGMIFASEALKKLNDIPSEDVEPVRHGKYIVDGWDGIYSGVGICSICNGTMMYGSKYCPRCGAKMDLED